MEESVNELHDLFFEFKCMLQSMDNIIDYCSNEIADVYYLSVFYKIIMQKAEMIDEIIENVYFDMVSKKGA